MAEDPSKLHQTAILALVSSTSFGPELALQTDRRQSTLIGERPLPRRAVIPPERGANDRLPLPSIDAADPKASAANSAPIGGCTLRAVGHANRSSLGRATAVQPAAFRAGDRALTDPDRTLRAAKKSRKSGRLNEPWHRLNSPPACASPRRGNTGWFRKAEDASGRTHRSRCRDLSGD